LKARHKVKQRLQLRLLGLFDVLRVGVGRQPEAGQSLLLSAKLLFSSGLSINHLTRFLQIAPGENF
jgi:hypothetical protein